MLLQIWNCSRKEGNSNLSFCLKKSQPISLLSNFSCAWKIYSQTCCHSLISQICIINLIFYPYLLKSRLLYKCFFYSFEIWRWNLETSLHYNWMLYLVEINVFVGGLWGVLMLELLLVRSSFYWKWDDYSYKFALSWFVSEGFIWQMEMNFISWLFWTADIRVHEFFKTSYFKKGIHPIPGAQQALQKLSRFCNLSVVTYVLATNLTMSSV